MLPRLNRGTLAEQVTGRLLEYIDTQHLKPGDLLPSEGALATSFGVSRPVVREALKNLEGKGVLEIVNGKGALIRPIDSDPLRQFFGRVMQMEHDAILELMEVRRVLEVQAAVLASQRRTEKDLAEITKAVEAMRRNMHDLNAYSRYDVDFHLRIAAASHNTVLRHLIESVRDALHKTIYAGLNSRGPGLNLEPIQQTHEALVQVIGEGNPEAARIAMIQHFKEAISALNNPQQQ